jgi:hypothetical protein
MLPLNDGTDDIMISHAWLDYDGRKTDITLANTERPDIIPIGQVIIRTGFRPPSFV